VGRIANFTSSLADPHIRTYVSEVSRAKRDDPFCLSGVYRACESALLNLATALQGGS